MTTEKNMIEECLKIFVTWKALIGISIGLIGIAITAAFAYGVHETTQDNMLDKNKIEMDRQYKEINSKLDYVNKMLYDMDTLKTLLRSPNVRTRNH